MVQSMPASSAPSSGSSAGSLRNNPTMPHIGEARAYKLVADGNGAPGTTRLSTARHLFFSRGNSINVSSPPDVEKPRWSAPRRFSSSDGLDHGSAIKTETAWRDQES